MLTVTQLFKKFPTLHETRRFPSIGPWSLPTARCSAVSSFILPSTLWSTQLPFSSGYATKILNALRPSLPSNVTSPDTWEKHLVISDGRHGKGKRPTGILPEGGPAGRLSHHLLAARDSSKLPDPSRQEMEAFVGTGCRDPRQQNSDGACRNVVKFFISKQETGNSGKTGGLSDNEHECTAKPRQLRNSLFLDSRSVRHTSQKHAEGEPSVPYGMHSEIYSWLPQKCVGVRWHCSVERGRVQCTSEQPTLSSDDTIDGESWLRHFWASVTWEGQRWRYHYQVQPLPTSR